MNESGKHPFAFFFSTSFHYWMDELGIVTYLSIYPRLFNPSEWALKAACIAAMIIQMDEQNERTKEWVRELASMIGRSCCSKVRWRWWWRWRWWARNERTKSSSLLARLLLKSCCSFELRTIVKMPSTTTAMMMMMMKCWKKARQAVCLLPTFVRTGCRGAEITVTLHHPVRFIQSWLAARLGPKARQRTQSNAKRSNNRRRRPENEAFHFISSFQVSFLVLSYV